MLKNSPQKGAVEISTIAAVVIVAAVVAIVSIYATSKYYEGANTAQPVAVISPIITPIATPTPLTTTPMSTPVIDEKIADWKTYINKEYEYQIKYPSNFIIKEVVNNDGFGYRNYTTLTTKEIIEKYGKENNQHHYLWINQQWLNGSPLENRMGGEKTTIGTVNFLKVVQGGGFSPGGFTGFSTSKDDSAISIVTSSASVLADPIFTEILSSFKFINRKNTTSWKNYSSLDNKFSIKYPSDWSAGKEMVQSTGTEIEISKSPDAKISIKNGIRYNQNWGRNYTLKEWIDSNRILLKKNNPNTEEITIALNYTEATQFNYKSSKNVYIIYGGEGDTIYEIEASFDPLKDTIYNPLVNQILSTFEFTK